MGIDPRRCQYTGQVWLVQQWIGTEASCAETKRRSINSPLLGAFVNKGAKIPFWSKSSGSEEFWRG